MTGGKSVGQSMILVPWLMKLDFPLDGTGVRGYNRKQGRRVVPDAWLEKSSVKDQEIMQNNQSKISIDTDLSMAALQTRPQAQLRGGFFFAFRRPGR